MNLLPDKAIETRSITRQLTASLLITVLVVSVIAITAMHRVVSQAAIRGLEQKADETLEYLAGTLEMPLWSVDEEVVKAIGEAVSNDESIVRLIVRNEAGTVVYSMEKRHSGDLINRSGKIIHKQWNRENPAGDVSVSLSPEMYNESDRRLLFFSMLIIVLILIAIAIVTVVFIRRSLNKPLKSLNEITSLFAAGIYDTSDHTLPYLEFHPFGKALAEMASKIEGQIRMVRKGEEDLRRMNERFVLATHAAQLGVWDWDIPKNELVWDDSMYRLYGIQKGDFGGAYDAWARTIHPQDKAQTEGEIQAALRGEREYAPEFRIVRPDGAIRYLKAESQTYRDEDGRPLRMIGTNLDITERKQAEEALNRLNEELEQRVGERTKELERRNHELEQMNKAFVGRELKMVALKERIRELEKVSN